MRYLIQFLKSKRGDTLITIPFVVMTIVFLVMFYVKASPAFLIKQKLDTYASELCRVAEVSGRIGTETTVKAQKLNEDMGFTPKIEWSKTGNIQMNETVTVTCTTTYNLGQFGGVGSFPVTLRSKATGQSEVYWK